MLRAIFLYNVISWALVQYTAGNLLGGGTGSGWYPPQPRPFIPPPPQPVVENPVCLEWGNNVLNPLIPLGLNRGGSGCFGGLGCTGYSTKICPLGPRNVDEITGREIVEVIDERVIVDGSIVDVYEKREVFDVKNQFYPNNYNPFGPLPYPYYPPSQPSSPYFPPPPVNIGFQTGASRSLGDE